MTKYAAHDKFSIYAIGETPEAAIAQARDDARDDSAQFDTAIVSDKLAAKIMRDGWDGNRNSFDVRHGEIFDTTDR